MKFAAPNSSEIEVEHERITELEQLLSQTLAAQTELTDELALKGAMLEHAKANAAEAKGNAELERREIADRLLVQTSLVKQKDAELETKENELVAVRSRLMDVENGRAEAESRAEVSLRDQVTQWQNKYEALAKLYTELRTEHLDVLSKSKQLQLKASTQTTAGESVHGSWMSRMVGPRAEQRKHDHSRIKLLNGKISMRLFPSCTASYVRSTLMCSQRANSCSSRPTPRLQQASPFTIHRRREWLG